MQLQSAFTYGKPAERHAGGCCSGRTFAFVALPRLAVEVCQAIPSSCSVGYTSYIYSGCMLGLVKYLTCVQ